MRKSLVQLQYSLPKIKEYGEVPSIEREAVLKTVVGKTIAGAKPVLAAKMNMEAYANW